MPAEHFDNGNSTKSLVSMRDYVDLLYKEIQDDLAAQEKLLCVKIDALDKATSLAKDNLEIRMAGQNEWRQQSKDREELFARKEDTIKIETRVSLLEIAKATLEGKASQTSVTIAYIISAVGILLGVIDLILRLK